MLHAMLFLYTGQKNIDDAIDLFKKASSHQIDYRETIKELYSGDVFLNGSCYETLKKFGTALGRAKCEADFKSMYRVLTGRDWPEGKGSLLDDLLKEMENIDRDRRQALKRDDRNARNKKTKMVEDSGEEDADGEKISSHVTGMNGDRGMNDRERIILTPPNRYW